MRVVKSLVLILAGMTALAFAMPAARRQVVSIISSDAAQGTGTGEELKASGTQAGTAGNQDELLIQQLSAKVPEVPTFVDRETVDLMRKVALTKRERAARVLVKSLAYNLDPINRDEELSDTEMIPAIRLLQDYFGEGALTPLYEEGIGTTKAWYRHRIALAVRTITPMDSVKKMKEKALSEIGVYPDVFAFADSLTAEDLDAQLNAPREARQKEVDKAIDAAIKRNKQKKPH